MSNYTRFQFTKSIFANQRSTLNNLKAIIQALNFEENIFFSRGTTKNNVLTRFIPPDTFFSLVHEFRKWEGAYINAIEMAYILHPSSNEQNNYTVKQTKSIIAAPNFLEETEGNILIGQSENQEGEKRDVFFPIKNFYRHMYIIGKTGRGKSTFLTQVITSLRKKTESTIFVFDPHGDLLEDIAKTNDGKHIEYLNITESKNVFTFNPLFAFRKSDNEKAAIREGLLDIIKNETQEQTGNSNSGVATFQRIKQVLDIGIEFADAYFSYLTNEKKLDKQKAEELVRSRQLTLNDLPYLLLKEMDYIDAIQEIFKNNETEVGIYVSKLYESHTKQIMVAEAVQTRVEQLLHSTLRLVYEGNKLNIEEIATSGKMFLIPVSETVFGSHGSRALLQSLFYLIWDYKRRQKANRKDTYIFIDEFQNAQLRDIPAIISEGRKFKLYLIPSNQQLGQLKQFIKDAIFGNMGSVASFTVSADEIGAKTLAPYFGNGVTEDDLVNLPAYTAYMKTEGDSNKPLATFSFETIKPEEQEKVVNLEKLRTKSLEKYGEPIEEIKKRLSRKQKNPLAYFLGEI